MTAAAAAQDAVVIRGAVIHPVIDPDITGSTLLIQNGSIADIGPKVTLPKGARVIDAKGLHVYPGMIDSATSVGLAEIGSIRETQDTTELGDFNPQLRTLVAVNPASEHIPVARANGITSVLTMPEGSLITGQAALIHLDGWTWEEMSVVPSAALVLRFPLYAGGGVRGAGGGGGRGGAASRGGFAEARRRHQEQVDKLEEFFEQARRYQRAKTGGGAGFKRDHKFEAMLPVIEGKLPVVITAIRERAIKEALAFVDQQRIRAVLAGVRESGEVLAEIKKRNIPVILGETLALPLEEDSPYDAAFTLPSELHKQGILFAFGTFDSSMVRNLPYQAATSAAFGLPQAEALKAVTYNPAKIWGVDDKIGSISVGKWADLIITDGDPLETRTQIKEMLIRGKKVDLESKHTELYKKYMSRP
jgi:imidazolonepropionase-like amidohydrolase